MRVTFGYSGTSGVLPWLIKRFTKSAISHSYLRYQHPWGQEVCLEASWPVVWERSWEKAKKGKEIIKEIDLDLPECHVEAARAKIGNWYDVGNLFLLGAMMLLKWFHVKWGSWRSNPKQEICTDIQLIALGWTGQERWTPEALCEAVEQHVARGNLKGWQ